MAKKKIRGEDGQEYTVKEKKPIYKRVWFWILVVIIIGAIGSQMGDGAPATTEAATAPAATGTTENTIAATEAQTEAETEALYAVGDEVTAGDIGVVVNSVEEQESFESDNQFIDAVTTDGKFIVVDATLTNNASDAKTFSSMMFKIVDEQGRNFEALTDANLMMILEDQNLFLESVNPGMSRTGVFVFEVPADVETYSLEISGGLWSGSKTVIRLK